MKKDRKKGYEKKEFVLELSQRNMLIAGLVLAILASVLFVLWSKGIYAISYSFDMRASVINFSQTNVTKLGVSVDPDVLDFGVVPLESNVTKIIEIESKSDHVVRALIFMDGNITPYIKAKREVYLKNGEDFKLYVKFLGLKEGNYTGRVKIRFLVPKYAFMEPLLKYRE